MNGNEIEPYRLLTSKGRARHNITRRRIALIEFNFAGHHDSLRDDRNTVKKKKPDYDVNLSRRRYITSNIIPTVGTTTQSIIKNFVLITCYT